MLDAPAFAPPAMRELFAHMAQGLRSERYDQTIEKQVNAMLDRFLTLNAPTLH